MVLEIEPRMKKVMMLVVLAYANVSLAQTTTPQADPNAANSSTQQWQTSGGIMNTQVEASSSAGPEGMGGDPLGNDVPLDGGISALIAAGIGYGASRLKRNKNK